MAAAVQPGEGVAEVQYRITLPQKQFLNFDPNFVTFVEAEIRDSVMTDGRGQHIFRSGDPAFLTGLRQAMMSADPVIEFRLGFGLPNNMYWLPWQRHIIVDAYAKYQSVGTTAGHVIVIQSANELIRISRQTKVNARKGAISDIVQTIANENSIPAVIEPTDGKFLMIQNFVDDSQFILKRLIPRAVNKQGRAGYFFFIRDNTLHFHTLDYQANVVQLNYYASPGSDLESQDMSQQPDLWDAGIAGSRFIVHDPYTAETKEIVSNPDNAVKLSDAIYQFSSVNNGERNTPYHLGSNPLVEVTAIAQYVYQQARLKTFKSTVAIQRSINLRHGDLLNLILTQDTSKSTTDSGYYYVTSAFHTVKKQQVTSVYNMTRGELQPQSGSLTSQNSENQLTPGNKAPGQKPNLLEVQSSQQTKGGGTQDSTRTFASLTDPNTGQLI
jgi:hypothetical protein